MVEGRPANSQSESGLFIVQCLPRKPRSQCTSLAIGLSLLAEPIDKFGSICLGLTCRGSDTSEGRLTGPVRGMCTGMSTDSLVIGLKGAFQPQATDE